MPSSRSPVAAVTSPSNTALHGSHSASAWPLATRTSCRTAIARTRPIPALGANPRRSGICEGVARGVCSISPASASASESRCSLARKCPSAQRFDAKQASETTPASYAPFAAPAPGSSGSYRSMTRSRWVPPAARSPSMLSAMPATRCASTNNGVVSRSRASASNSRAISRRGDRIPPEPAPPPPQARAPAIGSRRLPPTPRAQEPGRGERSIAGCAGPSTSSSTCASPIWISASAAASVSEALTASSAVSNRALARR